MTVKTQNFVSLENASPEATNIRRNKKDAAPIPNATSYKILNSEFIIPN